jgi:hypothetical protein
LPLLAAAMAKIISKRYLKAKSFQFKWEINTIVIIMPSAAWRPSGKTLRWTLRGFFLHEIGKEFTRNLRFSGRQLKTVSLWERAPVAS